MAPSLQGLNIIHPPSTPSDPQDLLSAPNFPDLSAQLDLWTNLTFESDEPLIHRKSTESRTAEEDGENSPEGTPPHEAHDNVVTGTALHQQPSAPLPPTFDINHFLASLVDPFIGQHPGAAPPTITPSLAQLLSLPPPPPPAAHIPAPIAPSRPHIDTQPAPKRARTRKTSISVSDVASPSAMTSPDESNTSTPLSAAEDKRRRNTAASARFRLKKKEREAALEKRAKELESKVGELERECEGLRRENGWLKGLVVGVTGVAPQAAPGVIQAGTKRSREDGDKDSA